MKEINIDAHSMRRIVFETVPAFKQIKDRVSCSGDKDTKRWTVTVSLTTGLLSPEAEAIYDEFGTLKYDNNAALIADKIAAHFGLKVESCNVHFQHRQYSEVAYIGLKR